LKKENKFTHRFYDSFFVPKYKTILNVFSH
jgi:hypothetical protein